MRPHRGPPRGTPASERGSARRSLVSLSSLRTLRELVQNLREGVYITNARGEILDANPAMLAMFGVRSRAALAGRLVQEWIDPRQRVQEHAILAQRGMVRDF